MGGFSPTRRAFLAATGAGFVVAGCNREDDDLALIASAARGGMRQTFVDAVGWTEPNGRSLVLAFVPWLLTQEERDAAVQNRSVYPALSRDLPLLEVRLDVDEAGRGVRKVNPATLRAVQFVFWFFDDPTPVIRLERDSWPGDPEIDVSGLEGELRHGGYVNGAIRSRQLYRNARGKDEAYLVNLSFAQSLA